MKSLRLLLALLTPVMLFWGCSKEKSFEAGSGSALSQWEFSEGSNFFKGKVDTAYKTEVAAGVTALLLEGTSDDGTGSLTLGIIGLNTSAPGTYQSPSVLFDYSKATGTIYQSDISAAGQFTIEVIKIDSASIIGTFTGKAKDSTGALKTITSGKFNARFGSATPQPSTAQVTFWSKIGCNASGPIAVKLSNGQSANITAFTASTPACGAAGTATFNVAPGTYGYQAICGTDTLRGVVTVAANQCLRQEIVFGPPAPSAQYSLVSSAGNCSNYQVNGTYYAGKTLSQDTNTVVVQVNVTQVGAYTVSTNTVNGYSFSASGVFAATGVQNVTMKGQGIPVATGANNFTVTAGTSTCQFPVTVQQLPPGASLNAWSFTEGTRNFSGEFPLPAVFDDDIWGLGKALDMLGQIPNTDTLFDLYVQFPAGATQPIPGTYVTDPLFGSQNTSDFKLFNLAAAEEYYYAKKVFMTPPPYPDVKMTIIITSYDPVTKIVKGTFSGKAWNRVGTIVNITNGKFEVEVEF
jgi:hypothetical protein